VLYSRVINRYTGTAFYPHFDILARIFRILPDDGKSADEARCTITCCISLRNHVYRRLIETLSKTGDGKIEVGGAPDTPESLLQQFISKATPEEEAPACVGQRQRQRPAASTLRY